MLYIRKRLSIILVAILTIISVFGTAYANPALIYQSSDGVTPVTSGATYEKITRFTESGWLSLNVLRVDITNPDVKIDTLINEQSIRSVASTKSLAQSSGAIAAINGGFFEWTDTSGVCNPIGPVIKNDSVLTASGAYNVDKKDELASLSISKLNELFYDYWKASATLVAPNGTIIPVGRYNRPYWGYDDLSAYDRKWEKKSIGTDTPKVGCSDIFEMVVVDGVVTEMRQGQPAVEIPENGMVIVTRTRKGGEQQLINNFNIGDPVTFNISSTPDWTNMKAVINGGAILLKDGSIPEKFSHIPEGSRSTRNPRTVIGSSKDGKQLLMVTIDGRQKGSIGATLTEAAQLMKELGAYNAINLDGGGSTTMVSRTPGTNNLELVNKPSDGSMRRVNTAVGVFSTAEPTGELAGLFIDTEDDNVFVNTSRAFTVRGYDKYFNPVAVDPKEIKWSASGIKGTFKDNIFYPKSVGSGKVKASAGNVSQELEVSSLSSPVQLILNRDTVKLPLNSTVNFSVKGKNKNGYYAKIDPKDVKWTVKGGIGKFTEGVFTATNQGSGYIDAAIGNTHAYCGVSIETVKTEMLDKFEETGSTFISYPATVPGSFELSNEQAHSGKTSGKLSYDFSNVEGSRAAYIVFKDNGISLASNTKKIGLWVYNTHENPNWLGAWVNDSKGKQHTVYFTKDMNWTGWKYVEASVEGIAAPSKLTRVYMVQPNPVADSGCIYVDDISMITSSFPAIASGKIPKDTVPADDANKNVAYKKSSNSFRFSVFGQAREPKNSLEKLLVKNLTSKINSYADISAFVGASKHEVTKSIKKPVLATGSGYKSMDMVNSRFIQLDMSKNSLRTSNSAQWGWFLNQLDSAKGSNVFILLANAPENFSDNLEANLFQDVLTKYKQKTGKNIWVFYKGDKNSSYMERGIKYISTAGYEVAGLTPKTSSNAKYILVTVKGSSITYEFKPIV